MNVHYLTRGVKISNRDSFADFLVVILPQGSDLHILHRLAHDGLFFAHFLKVIKSLKFYFSLVTFTSVFIGYKNMYKYKRTLKIAGQCDRSVSFIKVKLNVNSFDTNIKFFVMSHYANIMTL